MSETIQIDTVKKFIINECMYGDGGEEVGYDLNLIELKIIDSLSVIKIITYVQSLTGITIELDEIDFHNFSSIRAIHKFIQSKQ